MLTSERATCSVLTSGSDLEGSWRWGLEVQLPQSRPVLPWAPHAFPPGPSLPRGGQGSRVQQLSPRLIVPSPGDGCSKNSSGLIVNQDETRVTGCERQMRPGEQGSECTPDAQGLGAATDSSRPRVAAMWERGQGSEHPDVWAGRTCSSPGHTWRAGLLSEPHRLRSESLRDGWGCRPHPSTSTCVPHQAAGEAALGVGVQLGA